MEPERLDALEACEAEVERLREALKKLASLGPTQAATVVSAIANEALAPTNRKDAE